MRTTILLSIAMACSGGATTPAPQPAAAEAPEPTPEVVACEDFHAYACGGWEASNELPANRARMVRSFTEIDDRNKELLKGILDDAVANPSDDRAWQMVGGFYAACLDEAAIDARGAEPVQPWLQPR